MIVYEKEDAYVFIEQHEHARISGHLMSAWDQLPIIGDRLSSNVIYAAYEHDRGWIDLDSWPLWNDAASQPYTFVDFPPKIRFLYYNKGLNEIEQINPYSALLCSGLYTTLVEKFDNDDARQFVSSEKERQKRIKQQLKVDEAQLTLLMKALILCDELSLFACMKEPGTPTSQYEWFARGFSYSAGNTGADRIFAEWCESDTIELTPYPFVRPVELSVVYKEVSKEAARRYGIAHAYSEEKQKLRRVLYTNK